MNLTDLAAPFPPEDIKHRQGPGGKQLPYVTARAIQDRLDAVCGPHNWKNEFRPWEVGTPGVLCGLSIKIGDEWVTKWDGAEQTDIEAMKGGLSDAMKRAAVQWGLGRYLYQDGAVADGKAPQRPAETRSPVSPSPAVASAQAPVVNPETAHPPTEKQVAFFRRLLDHPVFTTEERARAFDWLATKATRSTIKDNIDWAKAQVETRKPQGASA